MSTVNPIIDPWGCSVLHSRWLGIDPSQVNNKHNFVETPEMKRSAISESRAPGPKHFTQPRLYSPHMLKTVVEVFVLFELSHRNNTAASRFVSTCGTFSQGSSSLLSSHYDQQCSSFNSRKGLSVPSSFSPTEYHNISPDCRASLPKRPPSQLSDC